MTPKKVIGISQEPCHGAENFGFKPADCNTFFGGHVGLDPHEVTLQHAADGSVRAICDYMRSDGFTCSKLASITNQNIMSMLDETEGLKGDETNLVRVEIGCIKRREPWEEK